MNKSCKQMKYSGPKKVKKKKEINKKSGKKNIQKKRKKTRAKNIPVNATQLIIFW